MHRSLEMFWWINRISFKKGNWKNFSHFFIDSERCSEIRRGCITLFLGMGAPDHIQWRFRGANPTMAPSKLAMEFGSPSGAERVRKSNDSIVNLSKCKDFGPPPVSM